MALLIPRALNGAPLDADAWYNLVAAALEDHDARFTEIARRESVIAVRSSALSVANATDTVVPFTGTTHDNAGMWTAAAPHLITLPAAGLYAAFGFGLLAMATATTTQAVVRIRHNGTSVAESHYAQTSGDNGGTVTWIVRAEAGDTLSAIVWQNSGAAVNLTTARIGVVLASEV